MTFLDDVLAQKRLEVDALRRDPPPPTSKRRPGFAEALGRPGLVVIAEIKRRSPSKGPIAPDLDVEVTARAYARGGAAAISCLTDRTFFGAKAGDFENATTASLPVLRKDFIIDEIQLDESLALGASAVLLIVRALDPKALASLLKAARDRELDALVEVHDEGEIEIAIAAGAAVIGVNNRDLATLTVDPRRAQRLRASIPSGVLTVAESGVKSRSDVARIEEAGYDAVLIGETLVASVDPTATLRELMGMAQEVSR